MPYILKISVTLNIFHPLAEFCHLNLGICLIHQCYPALSGVYQVKSYYEGSKWMFMSSGSYLYMDASEGARARLISQYISASQNTKRCVEFYYYMYGADIATLNLYVRSTNQQEKLLWRRHGALLNFSWRFNFSSQGIASRLCKEKELNW